MLQSELDFIKNLRQTSPYISQHRGKKVVIYLPSEMIENDANLHCFVQDIVLLNNLGIKTVIALGATLQIDKALALKGLEWHSSQNIRITPQEHISTIQETIGLVRSKLEASFSLACAEQHSPISLTSGNWVTAKPKGIINGVNFQQTGALRKMNVEAIDSALNNKQVCLLTPLAYAQSGEVFNLNTLEQAFAISASLQADKLMIYTHQQQLENLPKSLNLAEVEQFLTQEIDLCLADILSQTLKVGATVKRVHLMDKEEPNAMLLELFTREGLGTLIYNDRYYQIRPARLEDTAAILCLIKPLENSGILTIRSKESVERDIKQFIVADIDGQIIGCSAIYPYANKMAELACLVVDPDHQGEEVGQQLLLKTTERALKLAQTGLFILTTHTDHWFKEQGFQEAKLEKLPPERQATYNADRQSKILIKDI